ncbi:Nicotinamide riboside kinase [Escovopsis weberi]|uniref:Nicotinamide riboside kinase n=1 Tax=Escovopsis weberi TaxID=150374 RepID=A0A0M9VTG1_ESCWE|nr:Nicotinamide riboside kinase [Escovopsis weberi]
MEDRRALIVAISGCSSSGKTTLARLLRDIFPGAFILHEDDFYRPETELPLKDGLLDWDCAEAIDVPALADALSFIRRNASLPPSLVSKEDKNSVGKCPVQPSTISSLKAKVASRLPSPTPPQPRPSHLNPPAAAAPRICLLDGFLLYPPSMQPVPSRLDLRIFLRTSYAKAKARRQARDGYVTLEGFWADPPGYVDKVVWPNYAREHAWLFEGGDVEGVVRQDVLAREGIKVPPSQVEELKHKAEEKEEEEGLDAVLEWMVDLLLAELDKHA